jgi:hypothetical protein
MWVARPKLLATKFKITNLHLAHLILIHTMIAKWLSLKNLIEFSEMLSIPWRSKKPSGPRIQFRVNIDDKLPLFIVKRFHPNK